MHRRKNYFIKKKFQFNFSVKFFALLLIESLLIAGLFLYISTDTMTTGFQNSILTVERTQNFFLVPFLLITLIVGIGISLAGMIMMILMSHKIAGPLYRFENVLKQLSEGDFTGSVHLRNNDQLTEVQRELNVLVNSLDQRFSRIKGQLKEAEGLLAHKEDPQFTSRIKAKLLQIREEIDHVKVSTDGTKDR